MEAKTAQVRIKRRMIIAEGSGERRCPINCGEPSCSHGGPVVFVTPTRAKLLVDAGAVDLVGAGPSEIKPAGPAEKKEKEKGKSSDAVPAGPSTDSASSSEPGKAESSSASVAVPASPTTKSPKSKKRGRPAGSKASSR